MARSGQGVPGYGIRRTQARHPADVPRHTTDANTACDGRVHGIRRTPHFYIPLIQLQKTALLQSPNLIKSL
jgi:hypothetical protein